MITKNDKYPVEGNFIINANTRLISVPTDFNKNGVGVVGDNAAETLEFVIDRYFDEYDLGLATNIVIQWSNSTATGKYIVPLEDIQPEPDVVKFKWILGKDAIGTKSGSIKFNAYVELGRVRLNTQPQTLSVKAGLEIGPDAIEDDSEGLLALRKGLLDADLAQPVTLLTDLPESAGLGELTVALEKAVADYGDNVVARWYKDGELIVDEVSHLPVSTLSYTVSVPGTYQVMLLTSKKIVDERAVNIDGLEIDFKYHTSVVSTVSKKCVVGAPSLVKIVTNVAAEVNSNVLAMVIEMPAEGLVEAKLYKLNAETNEFAPVGEAVSVLDGNISMPVTEDGSYKIVLTHKLNGGAAETESAVAKVILDPVAPIVAIEPEGDAQIGSVVLRAVVSNEDAMDALSYQWYFSDLKKDLPTAEPIIGATNAEYTPAGIKEGGVGSGYYKVIVSNSKVIGKETKVVSGEAASGKIID